MRNWALADVAGLTNAFPFFMYSQACYSGAFDQSNSIAKNYLASPHGAFAVVMNSREGWYDTTGGLAYSHNFAKSFWSEVFQNDNLHGGKANQLSKQDNLFRIGPSGYNRYIYFETNFLGDPETPLQLGATPRVIVTESGGSTNVAEGGATDSYTVLLNTQPTANVTIGVTPGSQVQVDKTSLTFTAGNWNVAQTVTVSAVDDPIVEGNHTGAISHQATSDDPNYNGRTIARRHGIYCG